MRRLLRRRSWQKSAARRAGKKLGGVCLNRGCIPSKALLHAARMIVEARESAHRGITFGPPQIELDKLRAWKNSIVEKLAGGVAFLAKKRGVQVLTGRGYFENSQTLRIETPEGQQLVNLTKPSWPSAPTPRCPRRWTWAIRAS
jgi:pyruvate/2-oxoglutarate dehydrogenase complex dihydrolipoamide dehydrogenase (E3) component